MTKLYLGIDVGTSGARSIVIDGGGKLLAERRSGMDEHGNNRRDSAQWWAAVTSSLLQLAEDIPLENVSAVCVDATSGTVLATDQNGQAMADALMYNDAVDDQKILDAIAANAPLQSAVHGASSALARSIVLQQQYQPHRIMHQADWIVSKLSGICHLSDESNALKTGYDPVHRCWPDWLDKTGVERALLPEVKAVGSVTGTVNRGACSEFGFSPNASIIAGMTDGCASFFATGASMVGDCVTALGSTITMKMLCDAPLFDPGFGIYSHRIGDAWLAGGASNTGGNVLAHFFDNEALAALSTNIDSDRPTGLDYYPLIKPGERFPHNDANWQPVLTPRPEDDTLFLQGLFEGMASIEAEGYKKLEALGAPKVRSIRTVGGGASNPVWTSIRQQATGAAFKKSVSTEAAMGVARFCLSVAGEADST